MYEIKIKFVILLQVIEWLIIRLFISNLVAKQQFLNNFDKHNKLIILEDEKERIKDNIALQINNENQEHTEISN